MRLHAHTLGHQASEKEPNERGDEVVEADLLMVGARDEPHQPARGGDHGPTSMAAGVMDSAAPAGEDTSLPPSMRVILPPRTIRPNLGKRIDAIGPSIIADPHQYYQKGLTHDQGLRCVVDPVGSQESPSGRRIGDPGDVQVSTWARDGCNALGVVTPSTIGHGVIATDIDY